jgi:hypothetical protein
VGPDPLPVSSVTLTKKFVGDKLAQFVRRISLGRAKEPLHTLLDSQVLVLNRLWQAVNVCSARRAFALLYQGHAQVVWADHQNNFATHDFDSWRDFSTSVPKPIMRW